MSGHDDETTPSAKGDTSSLELSTAAEPTMDVALVEAIEQHRFADALDAVRNRGITDTGSQDHQSISWDLISMCISAADSFIQKRLQKVRDQEARDEPPVEEPSLSDQCIRDLLDALSRPFSPKELLIVYLEALPSVRSVHMFEYLLETISTYLRTVPEFPKGSFLWTLEGVATALGHLPEPVERNLEGEEERMLMDAEQEVCEINDKYRVLTQFLKVSLDSVRSKNVLSAKDRLQVCSYTVKALASTLGLLDLSAPRSEKRSASEQHRLAILLGQTLNSLADPVAVLQLSECLRAKDADDELAVKSLSGAVYCYIVFCLIDDFPRVYSAGQLAEILLTFSLTLVASPRQMHVLKGLELIGSAMPYVGVVDLHANETHLLLVRRLLRALLQVMTYCQLHEARQSSLNRWRQLFSHCSPACRSELLYALFRHLESPSVRGFLADEWRKLLGESSNLSLADCQKVVSTVVFLPEGETTDLLDCSEHIISALNLLRFLLHRKLIAKTPQLGVYLSDLKKGLQLSAAHYKLQLEAPPANRTTANSLVPSIPPDMDRKFFGQALARFDLMEHVLGIVQGLYDAI